METIKTKYLNQIVLCKEIIKFFERNKIESFPVYRLNEIKGDFNGIFDRINASNPECEYDKHGNITKKNYQNQYIIKYEYDERGNIIKEIQQDGSVYQWEYEYYDNGQLKSIHASNRQVLFIPKI